MAGPTATSATTSIPLHPPRSDLVARRHRSDGSFSPHVAPLQFAFYTRPAFPESYRVGVFVAEHFFPGSASRAGYRGCLRRIQEWKSPQPIRSVRTGFVPNPAVPVERASVGSNGRVRRDSCCQRRRRQRESSHQFTPRNCSPAVGIWAISQPPQR